MESDQLYAMIRRWEGLRLNAYLCPAGVWTCGYGSTGPDILPGIVWTLEQAEARMQAEANTCMREALALCPSLAGGALIAISDFVYNIGATKLRASTLRRKINSGDMTAAKYELMRWVKGGGRVLPGLVARRAAEAELFSKEY